ncbi:UDP-N-acetylmuramate--L-alanine ligase, partial [Candidatus Aerophobetes bacterium]|nr:UDP-N-acetylmuramate--L-alanine ligase [Candidatus Aerophobetes bacterium]
MGKKVLGEIKLPLAGIHNIYNFLAAFGVASTLGFDFPEVKKAVLSFEGVKRRMEKIGTLGQVPVFDDYAHHPTEIRAVLGELKKLGRRLIVIFQPHRFTRVKLLLPNFIEAFHNADILILTPIYPAGERPIPGVSGRLLFEALKKKRNLPTYYISSREKIVKFVMRNVQKEDIILTLGAGDITSLFRKRESLSR